MPDFKFHTVTDQDTGVARALVTIPADPSQPVVIDPVATAEQLRGVILQMASVFRAAPANDALHKRLLTAIEAALPYLPKTQEEARARPSAIPAVYRTPVLESQRLRDEADALDRRDVIIRELRQTLRLCGIIDTSRMAVHAARSFSGCDICGSASHSTAVCDRG